MKFYDYIDSAGVKAVASITGVSIGCVYHWRNGIRTPRPEQAAKLVKNTKLTYTDIYGDKPVKASA